MTAQQHHPTSNVHHYVSVLVCFLLTKSSLGGKGDSFQLLTLPDHIPTLREAKEGADALREILTKLHLLG